MRGSWRLTGLAERGAAGRCCARRGWERPAAATIDEICFASLPNESRDPFRVRRAVLEPRATRSISPRASPSTSWAPRAALDSKYHTVGAGNAERHRRRGGRPHAGHQPDELVAYDTPSMARLVVRRYGIAGRSARTGRPRALRRRPDEPGVPRSPASTSAAVIRCGRCSSSPTRAALDVRSRAPTSASNSRVAVPAPGGARRGTRHAGGSLIDTVEENGRRSSHPADRRVRHLPRRTTCIVTFAPWPQRGPGRATTCSATRARSSRSTSRTSRSASSTIATSRTQPVAWTRSPGASPCACRTCPGTRPRHRAAHRASTSARSVMCCSSRRAEIAAREKQELDNRRQIQDLAPLRTEFIQILYAEARRSQGCCRASVAEPVAAGGGVPARLLSARLRARRSAHELIIRRRQTRSSRSAASSSSSTFPSGRCSPKRASSTRTRTLRVPGYPLGRWRGQGVRSFLSIAWIRSLTDIRDSWSGQRVTVADFPPWTSVGGHETFAVGIGGKSLRPVPLGARLGR